MAHSPEPGGLHGPDQTPLGGWPGVGAGQGAESNTFLKFRLFFSLFDKRKRGVGGGEQVRGISKPFQDANFSPDCWREGAATSEHSEGPSEALLEACL